MLLLLSPLYLFLRSYISYSSQVIKKHNRYCILCGRSKSSELASFSKEEFEVTLDIIIRQNSQSVLESKLFASDNLATYHYLKKK
jgi:hypothetical protein